jgi:pilus assembly protein CpaC
MSMTSNHRTHHPGPRKLTGVLLATSVLLSPLGAAAQPYGAQAYAPAAPAPQGAVQDVVADPSGYAGQLSLPIGGTRILRFNRPVGQVMVGNAKVGDVIPLGERTLYVIGKSPGPTSLTVMPRGGGAPLATLDVRVGYDVDNIRRATHEIMPNEALAVSARGDGIVLTGALSSSAAVAQAASIAEQYAPGHVVNLTTVRAAEQVMLSVRVAEVQRSALQQLGLKNFDALWDTTGAIKLLPPVTDPAAVANLIGRTMAGKNWTFQALFDALETHGFSSTLAEPNLVALSGQTAVFFAGGEFPVPIPQTGLNSNTITIEYKQYGVSIGFTPTVVGDTINLVVAPEVSALDQANAVVLQGFRIPALTTRRAKTTVELRNGQSFAIAGLISRDFTDNLNGIPGIQRTPLFGALFRSTAYQNNESEVVIIVTAHLARPTHPDNLIAPTDVRMGPSEPELYVTGATDVPIVPGKPQASLPAPQPLASAAPSAPSSPALAAAAKPALPAPAATPAPAPEGAPKASVAAVVTTPASAQPAEPAPVATADKAAAPLQTAAAKPPAIVAPIAPVPARAAQSTPLASQAVTQKPLAAAAPSAPAPVAPPRPAPLAAADKAAAPQQTAASKPSAAANLVLAETFTEPTLAAGSTPVINAAAPATAK